MQLPGQQYVFSSSQLVGQQCPQRGQTVGSPGSIRPCHVCCDKRNLMTTTPERRRKRRPFSISRWSVQRKLLLAFWLVSVIPTMIAAELAATTLSQIFDSNVRIWLQESTKIVKDEIGDILHDNARMAKLFLRYTAPPSNRQAAKHDRLTADIAEATDIDVVSLIRVSDHKIVFSTAPDDVVKQINLTSNAVLQTIQVA